MLAPIAIFTYNRLSLFKQVIKCLKDNPLHEKSDLFIFIDGPKNEKDKYINAEIEEFSKSINGFKSIVVNNHKVNKGLAVSIINGVTELMNKFGKVIVIEDDLYLSKSFLIFMNLMLDKYENNMNVFQISGFGVKIKIPGDYEYDIYYSNRAQSWGWASWSNCWNTIDWEVKDFVELSHNSKMKKEFNKAGSDLYKMLKGYMNHKNDSWYIRFCYAQFKQHKYTIIPLRSLVMNNGFGKNSTHCDEYNRYNVDFQNKYRVIYKIPQTFLIDKRILGEAYSYVSIKARIYGKIMKILIKIAPCFCKHSLY
jgi:hypothetical protein